LKAAEFQHFDDDDYFGDRDAWLDADWAVISQRPAAGAKVTPGTKIHLSIGKISDSRTVGLLPASSDIARAAQAKENAEAAEAAVAADAAAQAQQAADVEYRQLLAAYVRNLTPITLVAKRAVTEVDNFARDVRNGRYGFVDESLTASSAVELMSVLATRVSGEVPQKGTRRAGAFEQLSAAAGDLGRATESLLAASGSTRKQSIQAYFRDRNSAAIRWNNALHFIYSDSGSSPTLLSIRAA